VPDTNKAQGARAGSPFCEELGSSSSKVEGGKGDASFTKNPAVLESAAIDIPRSDAADGASPASRQNDDHVERASATSREEHLASENTTSSDQPRPDSSPPSEDACEINQNSSGARLSQSDPPAHIVPTGNLIDFGDGGEQTTVDGSTSASGSSSLVIDIPSGASRQTTEQIGSPILPPIPKLCSDFGDLFGFGPTGRLSRTERTPLLTSGLTNLFKPQDSNSASPIRTLFPSIPRDFPKAEQNTVSRGMTHAKAAALRLRNQKLEEQCDSWKKKYEELEAKYHELEAKYQGHDEDAANRKAAGADW